MAPGMDRSIGVSPKMIPGLIYCVIRRLCITCIARASLGILNAGDLEKRCVHAWSVSQAAVTDGVFVLLADIDRPAVGSSLLRRLS